MAPYKILWGKVAKLSLILAVALAAPLVQAAGGGFEVSWQYASPVLQWSNHVGDAYIIEASPNFTTQAWQQKAVITTDAATAVWADDAPLPQTQFYRVRLATNPAPFQTLQQALKRACTNQHITGASAAALLPQYGLWLGTCGTSEGVTAIRPQTPFEIASITKTFIAVTVLKLVEKGQLSLDDTIGKWLPSLNCTNISPTVTIRQLLSHRSGIYNFGDDVPFQLALFADLNRYWQPEEVFDYVHAPSFPPGAGGEYSNTGYVLLGMIIRSASGGSVDDPLRTQIFAPVGLRNTVLGARTNWNGELADPHFDITGDGVPEDFGNATQTSILTSFWTSGGIVSTPADLVRFSSALFENGLLSTSSLSQMCTVQPITVGPVSLDYGFGIIRYNILGHVHWAHSGGLFGEYSWFSYCPDTHVSLAVTYNDVQTVLSGPSLPSELLIAISGLTNSAVTPALENSAKSLNLPLVR